MSELTMYGLEQKWEILYIILYTPALSYEIGFLNYMISGHHSIMVTKRFSAEHFPEEHFPDV